MVSEPHVEGTEFGELQLAVWRAQFQALRDGDRIFYGNDPVLDAIVATYGIDHQRTLTEVIADNTDVDTTDLPANAFLLADARTDSASADQSVPEPAEADQDDADDDRLDPDGDPRRADDIGRNPITRGQRQPGRRSPDLRAG